MLKRMILGLCALGGKGGGGLGRIECLGFGIKKKKSIKRCSMMRRCTRAC